MNKNLVNATLDDTFQEIGTNGTVQQQANDGVAVFPNVEVSKCGFSGTLVAAAANVPTKTMSTQFPVIAYGPQVVMKAYGLNNVVVKGQTLNGKGQTIAIVIPYHDPELAKDVDAFDFIYNVKATRSLKPRCCAAGFLTIKTVGEINGQYAAVDEASNPNDAAYVLTDESGHWEDEESLDVEW